MEFLREGRGRARDLLGVKAVDVEDMWRGGGGGGRPGEGIS